jgi:hypothetical protein
MSIKIDDEITGSMPGSYGASMERVLKVISSHTTFQDIMWGDERVIRIYSRESSDWTDLVGVSGDQGKREVLFALRAFSDLDFSSVKGSRPAELLERIVNRFGVDLEILEDKRRIIWKKVLPSHKGEGNQQILHCVPPDGHALKACFLAKVMPDNSMQISVAFALDMSVYSAWVHAHEIKGKRSSKSTSAVGGTTKKSGQKKINTASGKVNVVNRLSDPLDIFYHAMGFDHLHRLAENEFRQKRNTHIWQCGIVNGMFSLELQLKCLHRLIWPSKETPFGHSLFTLYSNLDGDTKERIEIFYATEIARSIQIDRIKNRSPNFQLDIDAVLTRCEKLFESLRYAFETKDPWVYDEDGHAGTVGVMEFDRALKYEIYRREPEWMSRVSIMNLPDVYRNSEGEYHTIPSI